MTTVAAGTAGGALDAATVPRSGPPRGIGVEVAVARRGFRTVWVGAFVCAVVFGATAASSAITYVSSFPDQASRAQLVLVTGGDAGLAVLLGPVGSIGTVGGYTFYKGFVFLTTIGAVWAVLAGTRVLRGEEDRGRWELVLSGGTRPARATGAVVAALGAAVAIILVGTTAITWAAGLDPDVGFSVGDSLVFGASMALVPAVFALVGAVTSQLGRTRRAATGLGMVVLAVMFALRMLGDAGPGTAWMRWLTPFGWSELMEPFTGNDLRPLIPTVVTLVVLAAAAVVLSGRRDLGDGVLSTRDVAAPRRFGLGSSTALTLRLELPTLVAWSIGAAAWGLMLGIVAKMTTESLPDSFAETLDRFGVRGTFVNQYLGVAFLMVATVVALLPASQIGAAAAEETSGRAVHVLSGPTSRTQWLAGRLAIAAVAVLVAGVLSGFATWVGAWSQGVEVGLGSMLVAGLNVVPTALVALGVGALVLAIAPRFAAGAVYGVVAWSLIVDLLSSLQASLAWIDRLSLFNYLALAPSQDPDPVTIVLTLIAAAVLCGVAVVLFGRRDIDAG